MKRLLVIVSLLILPLISFASTDNFNVNLTIGSRSADVLRLQQFFNQNGFTVASEGPGSSGQETNYYGPATAAAVSRYQEAYIGAILVPNNLKFGTGHFYGSTRAHLNALYGSGINTPTPAAVVATPTAPSAFTFNVNLTPGMEHPDVVRLQQFLNRNGFTVSFSGAGSAGQETSYFGPATQRAVKAFQEANAATVLIPNNLTAGTGLFYPSTRAAMNIQQVGSQNPIASPTGNGTPNTIPTTFRTLTIKITGNGAVTTSSGYTCSNSSCAVVLPVNSITALTNSPSSGYTFSGWSGDCSGSGSCSINLSKDSIVTADFSRNRSSGGGGGGGGSSSPTTYSLNTSVTGSGSISGDGIDCGSDCSESYNSGTSVTLTAVPDAEQTFTGWSGDCSGISTCILTLSQSRTVSATFVASSTPVAGVCGSANGANFSSAPSSNLCSVGTSSSVTGTGPWNWSCVGLNSGTTASCSATVTPTVNYDLTISAVSNGTVTGTGISCGGDCTETYASGTSVTLTATPDSGYDFAGWSGACTGTGACVASMTADRTIGASFTVTPAVSSSTISLSSVPSRTTGVAPLAVHFDATGTTDTETTQPFLDLEYEWDFGDAAGGAMWPQGNQTSKNSATGGVAGHLFESPGTYTVTLDVTNGSSSTSTSHTIVVTDPDTVFSGTDTRCISQVGDFTGCPAGATQVATSSMETVLTHIAPGRRILFRRGESWTEALNMGNITGPGIIGTYGTGANPDIYSINIGGSNASDWRVMDIDFLRTYGYRYTSPISINTPSSRMTFLRVKATGAGANETGTQIAFDMNIIPTDTLGEQVEHAIIDSEITEAYYGYYGGSDKMIFAGNYLSVYGGNQHVYRSFYATKGAYSNNTITGGGPSGSNWGPLSLVKQHAPGDNVFTEYLNWSDNLFAATAVYVSLGLGPENAEAGSLQPLRQIVVERNHFTSEYDSQLLVNLNNTTDSVVRNNLLDLTNMWGTAIQVQSDNDYVQISDRVNIYNNTIYKSDGAGQGIDAIQLIGPSANITVRNNLGYSPNTTDVTQMITQYSNPVNVIASNNTTDFQLKNTSPLFVNATPTLLSHFELQAGSYARNAGLLIPVYSDILRRLTPVETIPDIGAFERQ